MTLCALRGVARAAFNLQLMSGHDYQRICNVKGVRGEKLPAGRSISQGELSALMDACIKDKGPAGVRDAAMIGLMYVAGGLRRGEVVALKLGDYDPQSGEHIIHSPVRGLRLRGRRRGMSMVDSWHQLEE